MQQMSDEQQFENLIRRVRAGDAEAAAELVKGYEPTIRRMVRMRMRDSR
jgi:DNA-directed RNA polymerase specialized sigma subunit